MPVQTPVPIRLPGSFPPNVPQPSGHNSSPLPPPADYYVSRKELLEIAPDLGVMKSVPSAANDTVVLFDDKGQVKSSGVKLSDKADTKTVETLVGKDEGKSAREIAKEEVNQLLGEDPNELYDTFTEVSEFIDEAKQNYQAINNALSETAKSLSTKADKTALADEVARATQSEAQIDGKINTIVADDAGKSARTIAAEEVAKVVADAPADFDTLKEIAEYIESDKTGAAQMVTKIDDNAKAITAEVTRATKAEVALDKTITEKVGAVENGMMAVVTMAESAQQAADTAQQAADTAQQAADTAQQTADTALTTAQMADSSVLDLSARCDDIDMVARNAEEHASMANTTASLAMETANAAYSPTNPPPAPDLSGYATKSEIPYSLIEVPLADRINLTDRAVNKVTADGSLNYIQFVFPEKKEGKSRDFFLRLVITGETVPTLSFSEPTGGSVSFDSDNDSWADIEQGVNILMFTDTEA